MLAVLQGYKSLLPSGGSRISFRYLKRRFLAAGVLLLLIFVFSLLPSRNSSIIPSEALRIPNKPGHEIKGSKIRLLIPATNSNSELCKTIISATILNYTAPILIGWGTTGSNPDWRFNGTHIDKITGVARHLVAVNSEFDYDLVLIIDGFDSWFQLGPEVMASRYRQTNKELFDQTKSRMGAQAFTIEDINQSIVFSADKNCGPSRSESRIDNVSCYGQTESSLPKDAYGPDTDILDPEWHLPFHVRPAFLNSGVIIGQIRDLRKMYEEAKKRIYTMQHGGSDQLIFNAIYGEQQYQREVMRVRHRSVLERLRDSLAHLFGTYTPSIIDPHPTRIPMEHLPNHPLEFGIGLDYKLSLSHSTVLSEFDMRWIIYGDAAARMEKHQHPAVPISVPQDIMEGPLPFIELKSRKAWVGGRRVEHWGQLALYTNLFTGSVPVIIHMNGKKTMRHDVWGLMWYHSQLRAMLTEISKKREVGAWADTGEWLSWDSLCRGTEDEVFRDGQGPWVNGTMT